MINRWYLQIAFSASLLGLVPILVRFCSGIGVFTVVFFRFVITSIAVFTYMKLFGFKIQPIRDRLKYVLYISIVMTISIAGYFTAVLLIEVASAVLLLKTLSFWVIVFSLILLKEKLDINSIISLTLGFIGIVLILYGSLRFNLIGVVVGAVTAIFASLVFIFVIKWFSDYDVKSLMIYYMAMSSLMIAPLAMTDFSSLHAIYVNLPILITLSILCTVIPYLSIFSASYRIKGQFVGVLQNSEMILPIILAYVLFNEQFHLTVLLGGVFICLSYVPILLKKTESDVDEQKN